MTPDGHDGCGYVATDTDGYNTYAAWSTLEDVKDLLDSIDWTVDGSATLCPDCSGAKVKPDYNRESLVEAIGQEIAKCSADLNARLADESPKADD